MRLPALIDRAEGCTSAACCYELRRVAPATARYKGCTVDLVRRLRQHNGSLAGGARSTRGRSWRLACAVLGFATRSDALSYEWHWKRPQRFARWLEDARERWGLQIVRVAPPRTVCDAQVATRACDHRPRVPDGLPNENHTVQ